MQKSEIPFIKTYFSPYNGKHRDFEEYIKSKIPTLISNGFDISRTQMTTLDKGSALDKPGVLFYMTVDDSRPKANETHKEDIFSFIYTNYLKYIANKNHLPAPSS